MKCKICDRKSESGFCKLHEGAHKNLLKNYEAWKKSMNISWGEYLVEIHKNPYAGIWAKEVAQALLALISAEDDGDSASGLVGKT